MWKLIIDLITSLNTSKEAGSINPLQALTMLRSASDALVAQTALHAQLALAEWKEEKQRLTQMLIFTLVGFAFFICLLLSITAFILTLAWDTQFRISAFLVLIVVHALIALWAVFRVRALGALSSRTFAATRAEIAADIALIKSAL
jgi:uncharacterized membrane protein YqjE